MFARSVMAGVTLAAVAAVAFARPAQTSPSQAAAVAPQASQAARHPTPRLDRTGRRRVGRASIYAGKFQGRKMADGTRMNPQDDSAASKTLPLGTTAKVTNLETGESAVVTIRDRGPFVKGRIVDLSPATADKVGLARREGVSKVEVTPIAMPPANDGAGIHDEPRDTHAGKPDPGSTPVRR
jgi:peptidoglycan lytic transglycosylase